MFLHRYVKHNNYRTTEKHTYIESLEWVSYMYAYFTISKQSFMLARNPFLLYRTMIHQLEFTGRKPVLKGQLNVALA